MSKTFADVAGKRLSLANLDKDFYPSYGFTKAQVLDYYFRISPYMLPHLKDRALTLKRYPDGAEGDSFFEKRCPVHRPSWVPTGEIPLEGGERMTVCLANDLNTLIWVENLASLELHVPLARADAPEAPDSVVFDLDPGEGADIIDCAKVGFIIRDLLIGLGLKNVVKTSGRKGLHVYVPLDRSETTFDDTKLFSKSVAEILARNYPDLITAKMAKEYRKEKVFINWSQNDASKTMVCIYSLRAAKKPTVSFPLTWEELEEAVEKGNREKLEITHSEALARAEKTGDLFRAMISGTQRLPNV
ncbi:MAG TPA: non-homologous end-joining DNA ligase [Syntrophorhabdaceae bacterium]